MEDPTPKSRAALGIPKVSESDFPIWDMLPDESREHYGWFVTYRDMAYPNGYAGRWERRTILGVARTLNRNPKGVDVVSKANRWKERALDFDHYLDSNATKGIVNEVVRIRRAQLRRMHKLAEFGEAELERHMRRADFINQGSESIPVTDSRTVLEILDRVTKTERLLLGETTSNDGAGQKSVVDLSGLSVEELRQIATVRKKLDSK